MEQVIYHLNLTKMKKKIQIYKCYKYKIKKNRLKIFKIVKLYLLYIFKNIFNLVLNFNKYSNGIFIFIYNINDKKIGKRSSTNRV